MGGAGRVDGRWVGFRVREEDVDAVGAEGPVEVVGALFERVEEGDGAGKGGEFAEGDRRKAAIFEGAA